MKKSILIVIAILCLASVATAANVTITTSITVINATYNGNGNTIIGVGLGDGSQGEAQKPLFRGTNCTITNVKIGVPGCDGIHMYISGTCSNVTWVDVGEDGASAKAKTTGGKFLVTGGTAASAADKFCQVNATNATFTVTGMTVNTALKVIRQGGGHTDTCTLKVSNSKLSNIGEAVIRTDGPGTVCTVTGCTLTNVKCLIMRSL